MTITWVKAKVTLLLALVACGITSTEGLKLRVRVSLKSGGRLFDVQNIEPIFVVAMLHITFFCRSTWSLLQPAHEYAYSVSLR